MVRQRHPRVGFFGEDMVQPEGSRGENDIIASTYRDLCAMAAAIRHGQPNATIGTHTLVHEVWLKLLKSQTHAPESALHLKRIVAKAMRQCLTDSARRRSAEKRGGREMFVTFDDSVGTPVSYDILLSLNDLLDELKHLEARQAEVVELLFYGGFTVDETAGLLGISEKTVRLDWKAAKAWLATKLTVPGIMSSGHSND